MTAGWPVGERRAAPADQEVHLSAQSQPFAGLDFFDAPEVQCFPGAQAVWVASAAP